jgi:hypothetical protein
MVMNNKMSFFSTTEQHLAARPITTEQSEIIKCESRSFKMRAERRTHTHSLGLKYVYKEA